MKVAGFDPGFSGAAALFGHPSGAVSNWPTLIDVYDFRTIGDGGKKRLDILHLQSWLQDCRPAHAYVENARTMPARNHKTGERSGMEASGGRYMRCAGHLEATIVCCGIDPWMVEPSAWKRAFRLVGPNKGNSIAMALELCPDARRWLPSKTRKGVTTDVQKYHNRAEAILLAIYGAARLGMIELESVD